MTVEDPNDLEKFVEDLRNKPRQLHMRSMTEQERLKLATALQRYHSVFKTFWEMASVVFSPEIRTAAVYATTSGVIIGMKINPDFWDSLTFTQQLWVICHECLHAILDHFTRGSLLENQSLANKMMDIVINQATIEKFGFKRSEIDPDNVYCWMDKFFQPSDNVRDGQSFEYYYNHIIKHPERFNNGELLDDHVQMSDEDFSNFIKEMNGKLTPQQKEDFKKWLESQFNMGNGNTPGGPAGTESAFALWTFSNIGVVKKKKRWETIIKNWVLKAIGTFPKPKEQWVLQDRRMTLLPKDIFLPYTIDEDAILKKKDKITVFFMLDTSGSCISYGERFFKAAKSIPTDKFDLRLFNFDTQVYDVNIEKAEVMGGGGTSFVIIENKIQEIMMKDDISYPTVFIITDGEGDQVTPQKPENWHWFMTEYHSDKFVHPDSNIYKLTDYE